VRLGRSYRFVAAFEPFALGYLLSPPLERRHVPDGRPVGERVSVPDEKRSAGSRRRGRRAGDACRAHAIGTRDSLASKRPLQSPTENLTDGTTKTSPLIDTGSRLN
jgi:hypothetical protein